MKKKEINAMSITFYITLLQQIRCYNMLLMAKK